jgi:hypothetical protein
LKKPVLSASLHEAPAQDMVIRGKLLGQEISLDPEAVAVPSNTGNPRQAAEADRGPAEKNFDCLRICDRRRMGIAPARHHR